MATPADAFPHYLPELTLLRGVEEPD